MYSKVFVVLTLAVGAFGHDIVLGQNNTEARNVTEGHYQASPAIWKQTQDLFFNVSEHEVISKINITDLRPDKDGDAEITSGGVGHRNVTITLKSPTILRGYDFLVSVYSVFGDETHRESSAHPQVPSQNSVKNPKISQEEIPTEIPHDVTTGKSDVFIGSGPTTVSGEPSEVPIKSSEVTQSTLSGDVTSTTGRPTTKEVRVPEVTETLDDVPEDAPVHVESQEPRKLQPFFGPHQLPSTTEKPKN